MNREQLALLRADVAARHKRMRFLQRVGHVCIAAHVGVGAWFASRVALGDYSAFWFALLNGVCAIAGVRLQARRWADWLALRSQFEKDIERMEVEP